MSTGFKVFQAEPMDLLHQQIVIPMMKYMDDTSHINFWNTYIPPGTEYIENDECE